MPRVIASAGPELVGGGGGAVWVRVPVCVTGPLVADHVGVRAGEVERDGDGESDGEGPEDVRDGAVAGGVVEPLGTDGFDNKLPGTAVGVPVATTKPKPKASAATAKTVATLALTLSRGKRRKNLVKSIV
jgi:hypothetical protein